MRSFFVHIMGIRPVLQTNNLWWTNRPEITLDTQCRLRCSAGRRYRPRSRNVGVLRRRSIICYRLLCGAACVIWFLNFSDPAFIQCQIYTRTAGTRSIVVLYFHYVLRISSNPKTIMTWFEIITPDTIYSILYYYTIAKHKII